MREYEVSVYRVDGSMIRVVAENEEDAVAKAKKRAPELLEKRAQWAVFDPASDRGAAEKRGLFDPGREKVD